MDLQQKLIRAFFISFALLMGLGAHYFQHNQGGSGLELGVNNVVWIFFSILIGLGLWKIAAQQKIYYSKYTVILFIALGLFLLPIFYPNNTLADQSYTRLLGLFAGTLFFLCLQQFNFNRNQIERLLLLVVLAGFLQACYGLTQTYLLPANNYFGYNINYGRPYGIFQQPNVLASFMATTLILSGYLFQKATDKRIQIFLLITVALSMWVMVLSISRIGDLGTFIGLLLLLPWAFKTNKKHFILFILAILLGFSAASLKYTKGISDFSIESALDNRSETVKKKNYIRINQYKNSWQMIQQKPLLGYGYGGFEKAFLVSFAEGIKNSELRQTPHNVTTHPHNELLFWAVEGGLIPILAILLLIVTFLRLLFQSKLTKGLALFSLVIPIALHTQVEYPLYHSTLHWFVLITLIFYVDYESSEIKEKKFTPTFFLKITGLLIPILTAIFMITNLHTIAKITEFERSKNPDIRILMDIINPLVFDNNFTLHLYNFRLNVAINNNNTAEMEKLISELEKKITLSPRPFFYQLLYIAYKHNTQPKRAAATLAYARYLYPVHKGLKNIDKEKVPTSNAMSTVSKVGNMSPPSASISTITNKGQ